MAYTLNTGHALYGNLVELIGVQSGALVSHKVARTFTKHGEASLQTGGAYGEALRTVGGGFTVKGASFTPAVSIDTVANPNATIVIIVNQAAAAGGGGQRPLVSSQTTAAGAFTVGMTSAGLPTALENWTSLKSTGTTDLDTAATPHMLAAVKIGETAHKLYVDGNFEVDSATRLAYNTVSGAFWDYLGGAVGQGSVAADIVWVAWFNKALSEAELDSLYSSLGAGNTFGLVGAASVNGTAPGATLNGSSSISAGAASGGVNGTAPGATLSSTSSLSAGAAAGNFIGLLASQIVAETATGDHGPGLLYDEALANPGHYLRLVVTSTPSSGTLTVYQNGSFELTGASDGVYTIGYNWYLDDALAGSDIATVVIGPVNASAPGATLNGASNILAGTADGQRNATAPGSNLEGTSSLDAGSATGGFAGDAQAPGATLNTSSSIDAGAADGQKNAAAQGAELNGASSLQPGPANGNKDGNANGADLTGAATLSAGSASNIETGTSFDATAFMTRLATLSASAQRAIGQPWTVGEAARLNVVAVDPDGTPYDPASLRLLVKPPAGAVTISGKSDFTRAEAGIYQVEIPLSSSGNWYWRVEADAVAVAEGALAVQPSRFVSS